MKYILVLLLATLLQTSLYAQSVTDLSAIRSLKDLTALRNRLNKEKNTAAAYTHYAYLNNALWHGIEVHEVRLINEELKMEVFKNTTNGAKNMIALLQQQYKEELKKDIGWSRTTYTVNNADVNIELSVNTDEDKPLAANTGAELSISFKPVYDEPYPNLAKKIAKNPDGIFYYLSLDYSENNIEVFINGISIYNGTARSRYINERSLNLNPFILGKENVALKIRITPGLDKKGVPYPTIQKRSYVTAELQKGIFKNGQFEPIESDTICKYKEYVTDTINDGDVRYSTYTGTYQYGGKELKAAYNFMADVSYQTKGWKDGTDLRNDKRLKEKIIALYEKLAKVIQAQDALALSALCYTMGEEDAVVNYNHYAASFTDNWSKWMDMFKTTNVIKIEKDFDIEMSEDGKLIYARPKTQKDMLRAIGKETATGFTQYIYEDNNTKELKFIR